MMHIRWSRRTRVGAIFLVLIAGFALAWAYGRGEGSATPLGHWQPVGVQPQVNELVSSGKLLPAKTVEIPSPAGGVVKSLAVTLGDAVVQGQQLGRIDSPELVAHLRTVQAAMLRHQLQDGAVLAGEEPADVLNARRRMLNAQSAQKTARARQLESNTLFSKGFLSRNDDEAATAEVQNADQQLDLAQEELRAALRKYAPDQLHAMKLEAENKRSELANLQERYSQLALKSPLTGVVLMPQPQDFRAEGQTRELAVGSRVGAGDAIMAIGDTSSFLIRGYCTEADSVWLEAGADAEVTLSALPDHTFNGKVTKVLGQARSRRSPTLGEEASYEFLVAFPAPEQPLSEVQRRKIRVGSTARLRIAQKSANRQTSIPLTAVIWAPDGAAQVRWRATAADAPQLKPIHIVRSNLAEVLVRETLEGEVWVPGGTARGNSSNSGLKRMFGLEE